MNTDMDMNEYKHVGPMSLTHLFLREKTHPKTYWIDAYKHPYQTLIFEYKAALQMLQLTILSCENNSAEIGHCFQKLEERFERIIDNFRED